MSTAPGSCACLNQGSVKTPVTRLLTTPSVHSFICLGLLPRFLTLWCIYVGHLHLRLPIILGRTQSLEAQEKVLEGHFIISTLGGEMGCEHLLVTGQGRQPMLIRGMNGSLW